MVATVSTRSPIRGASGSSASVARRAPPTTIPSSSTVTRTRPAAAPRQQRPGRHRVDGRPHQQRRAAPIASASSASVGSGNRPIRSSTYGSIRSRIAASFDSPMPGTSSRPSTVANGPCSSRHATMRCAVAGPTPGARRAPRSSAWLSRTIGGLPGAVPHRPARDRAPARRPARRRRPVRPGSGRRALPARGSARGRDGVAGPRARLELVDAGMPHRADDVHQQRAAARAAGTAAGADVDAVGTRRARPTSRRRRAHAPDQQRRAEREDDEERARHGG